MRHATFVVAIVFVSSTAHGGESPYNPGGSNASAANQQWSYFCRADSGDGRYFTTKPRPAFQGKNDGTQERKYSMAWSDYMRKTYGAQSIRYPQCNVMLSDQVAASYKSFVDNAAHLHEHTVDVDWQYTP